LDTKVALVVLACNEESLLEDCFRYHAPFFDYSLCLVSKSEDRTEEIARRNFDLVETVDFPGSFATLRDHANDASPCRWVLHVDTDERFPIAHLSNIRRLAERLPVESALGFPRTNPPSFPAPWPDYQYRLMPKETRYVGKIHEQPLARKDHLPATTENAITHLRRPITRIKAKIARWRSLGDEYWASEFEENLKRLAKNASG